MSTASPPACGDLGGQRLGRRLARVVVQADPRALRREGAGQRARRCPVEAPVISTAFPPGRGSEVRSSCLVLFAQPPSTMATALRHRLGHAQRRRVHHHRIRRRVSAARSARVASRASRALRSATIWSSVSGAAAPQFQPAAVRPHSRPAGDVQLHLGLGADHRADVAPVQHRAALGPRETAAGTPPAPPAPPGSPPRGSPPARPRPCAGRRAPDPRRTAPAAATTGSPPLPPPPGRASPVSRKAKPNRAATARAIVPLPAAAGPSIATVKIVPASLRPPSFLPKDGPLSNREDQR